MYRRVYRGDAVLCKGSLGVGVMICIQYYYTLDTCDMVIIAELAATITDSNLIIVLPRIMYHCT